MKRIKLQALVLSLALAATAISSCNKVEKKSEIKVRSDEDTEITEVTETTPEETTTEETTEATTTTEETTEATTVTAEAMADDSEGSLRFRAYRAKATELYNNNPELMFAFDILYGETPMRYYLKVFDPVAGEYTEYFYDSDGVMENWGASKATEYLMDKPDNFYCTYDAFMMMPCMFDGIPTTDSFIDTLDDGRYMGTIIAVNADAAEVLVNLGEPLIITEEEYLNLKVGDQIKVDYFELEYVTVTAVDESKTGSDRVTIDTTYGDGSEADLWLCQGVTPYVENENDYIFMSSNDCPVSHNHKIVALPISPDCEINDTMFGLMMSGGSYKEQAAEYAEENGLTSPLASMDWFYFNMVVDDYRCETSNGWYPVYGLLWPAEVEGGVLTYMNIEAR